MDTFIEITCVSSDKNLTEKAIDASFKEIERIEKLFNRYDGESELSRINKLAGSEKVTISSEIYDLIKRSVSYSELSGEDFDITVAPVVDIWIDARRNNSKPDTKNIAIVLKHVGYKNIVLDNDDLSIHFLDKDTKIDLGGVAKGYAVDRAKDILLFYGIEDALINVGGNIFALGKAPDKRKWRIGIRHPRSKKDIIHTLKLKNKAVSTSGDYERFFILDGKRYSHIINPHTGVPAEGVMSVTIVSDSAEKADFLSTAVFVMGPEDGLEFIKSLKNTEALIFDREGKLVKYP